MLVPWPPPVTFTVAVAVRWMFETPPPFGFATDPVLVIVQTPLFVPFAYMPEKEYVPPFAVPVIGVHGVVLALPFAVHPSSVGETAFAPVAFKIASARLTPACASSNAPCWALLFWAVPLLDSAIVIAVTVIVLRRTRTAIARTRASPSSSRSARVRISSPTGNISALAVSASCRGCASLRRGIRPDRPRRGAPTGGRRSGRRDRRRPESWSTRSWASG